MSTREEQDDDKIKDRYRNCGPLAGIHAGLLTAKSSEIFVIACDLPLIETEHVLYLIDVYKKSEADILVPKTDRIHPLCGIYSKNVLHKIESSLKRRELKLQKFLSETQTAVINITDRHLQKALDMNINTEEDYLKLIQTTLNEQR